jgi:phosphate transport system protein
MKKHTLHSFDLDLRQLQEEVSGLAKQVSEELDRALAALLSGDRDAAKDVIKSDRHTNALYEKIEKHTTTILTRQHAMADDLRSILAAGRIALHLERIGDYAKNTAKRSQRLAQPLDATISAQFKWMGERIQVMISRTKEAYEKDDAELANVAWADDDEIDDMYAKLFSHLLDSMSNNTAPIADSVQLMFIAKGLERAGDHVTDIAEEVYLKITGKPLTGARPKVDESESAGNSPSTS